MVRDRVNGLPSFTGPVLPKVAVGATLATVTVAVYSRIPPSLSLIAPRTVTGPLSVVGKLAVEVALKVSDPVIGVDPVLNAYVNPVEVSALEGSVTLVMETSIGCLRSHLSEH